YKCQCRRGFYHPSRVALNGLTGGQESAPPNKGEALSPEGSGSRCLPCREGCSYCRDDTPCLAGEDGEEQEDPNPSVLGCILLRWLRLLGFSVTYGTIILKIYRVLKVFLSRTAQRTPYMTSWRVLRLLGLILLVVMWFLVAWTSAVCQSPAAMTRTLISAGLTPQGLQFTEFLFLLWGVYLCHAVRTVPSAYHEPRYLTVAVFNELLLSSIFHLVRFSLAPGLHPDWMLLLVFGHTHLTVTVTLGLLLVPKFLSKGTQQAREDIATEAYEEELELGRSGSYLNNSITSAWSEHSLDPEDIRDELKKLYAQLEVYKRKKMLANNPHLQKKRSSKKGLGRSLMRRITEIPESMQHVHRQRSREDGEHGSNLSKSREESLKANLQAMKKSLSYDHVCDPGSDGAGSSSCAPGDKMTPTGSIAGEGSLLGSLIGRGRHGGKRAAAETPATPPPGLEAAESTESKSLSVIASAKEKMPGLGGKAHATEDGGRKGLKGRMLSEVDESPEHFPKMIVSQSVEYCKTPLKMGIMKQQVSGSQPSICSEAGGRNLYDLSEACPWEQDEAAQTPTEGKAQKHVSIAGIEGGSSGGGGAGSVKGGRSCSSSSSSHQSPGNRRRSSRDKGGERRDEARRQTRSPLPLKPDVSPWAFDEPPPPLPQIPGPAAGGQLSLMDSISPDRIRRKKSVTPTDGKPKAIHSDHSKSTGSLLQPPSLMVEICPWDYHHQQQHPDTDTDAAPDPGPVGPPSPGLQRAKGCKSPTVHGKRKRKGSCSSTASRPEREKGREKSRERRGSSASKPQTAGERRRVSQSSEGGGPRSGRRRSSTRDARDASAPPLEIRRAMEAEQQQTPSGGGRPQTKPSPERKRGASKPPPVVSASRMADVCPWDFEDADSGSKA
ncbi:hypothetical protein NHX12_003651, partial [Muraenolepis orangiensis]